MIIKLSISMPKSLDDFARSRVRQGGYGSISEYFRELVRIDQRYDTAKREPVYDERPEFMPPFAPPYDSRHGFGNKYR